MKVEELEQKFDDGEDVLEYLDFSTLRRPGLETTPFPLKDYRLYSSSSLAFFASWRFIK
ncbi:MAG: hypothetical protein WBB28_18360 [Crinalium sp.]